MIEKSVLEIVGEKSSEAEDLVSVEEPISIYLNGSLFTTAMISPEMKEEFIIGHLFSNGVIRNLEEIESVQIEGNIAKVIISMGKGLKALTIRKLIVSGCGGVSSFLDDAKLPKIDSEMKIEKEKIFASFKKIIASEVHKKTGGVHSCGMFNKKDVIRIAEDIGRHNALDKVIGYALREKCDISSTFAVCTGRISVDMALKCSFANLPIIASRGATTSLSVDIAEKTGLTIIGFVRNYKMNVYSNPERIEV